MFPIYLERDGPLVEWNTKIQWATAMTLFSTDDSNVRSDGLLHTDYATAFASNNTPIITAGQAVALGVHLQGPRPGDEYTPYQVSVAALTLDPECRPYLFMAESPATIDTAAAGNLCINTRMLAFGPSPGNQGSEMQKEVTFAVPVGTADRGICVAVGIVAGLGTNSTAVRALVRLSVRRLIGVQPRVIDVRKL